ncbi:hypothetical protein [Glaciihabitans sp. UYNi722]|uniref:hypothetical protein n=1 Tax=Glaciihabitans sp. UYNi722 TaxID=3156344 RepID=UPI0033952CB6
MTDSRVVKDSKELQAAVNDGVKAIQVVGTISGAPRVVLAPGVSLSGGRLEFGSKGVLLTRDNTVENIEVVVPEHEVAIYADTTQTDWGTLTLRGVTTVGQVAIIATDAVRSGHISIDGLTVRAADVRGRVDRPRGFGVEAMQGGLTVWNRQADASVQITAEITNVAAGSEHTPVRGSGVFVAGHGTDDGKAFGGVLTVTTLSTGEIHTDGGIAEGTPDLISGGVFVISGARVQNVINEGPVTTLGQNDMVLDNWGDVQTWTAKQPIISRGPSGIGFVNFSDIKTLTVQAPIQTYGKGARGFNLYDGSLSEATFESIQTHGDGSIGVQLSRPLPKLTITNNLSTEGGEGLSLVKGVQMTLKAIALSIRPGGALGELHVGGAISTSGNDIVSVELADSVGSWDVPGGIVAKGKGSDGVYYSGNGTAPSGVTVSSEQGKDVVADPTAS